MYVQKKIHEISVAIGCSTVLLKLSNYLRVTFSDTLAMQFEKCRGIK